MFEGTYVYKHWIICCYLYIGVQEKEAFTAILKDMRSQKTISRRSKDDGTGCFVVLREKMN